MRLSARRTFALLSLLSGGLLAQSSCPLESDFDALTLFAQSMATIINDAVFFAIDSYLVSVA